MKEISTKQFWIAVFLIVVGCGLLIAGFALPPLAEIHNSVLVAFGEVATFAGSILGIDYNYKWKLFRHTSNRGAEEKDK